MSLFVLTFGLINMGFAIFNCWMAWKNREMAKRNSESAKTNTFISRDLMAQMELLNASALIDRKLADQ